MFYYYKTVFQNQFAFFDNGTLLVHLPVTAARLFFYHVLLRLPYPQGAHVTGPKGHPPGL